MKLGQSFQLSEVRNKSEPLHKYIPTMQINLRLIVTLGRRRVRTCGYRL